MRKLVAERATSSSSSPRRRAAGSPTSGYDPFYGARPLKRAIQRKAVQDPLAEKLLAGEVLDGAVVLVTQGLDGLEVTTPAAAPAAVMH